MKIKNVISILISIALIIPSLSVYADDIDILEKLEQEDNSQSFCNILDNLTADEINYLGIDLSIYNALAIKTYVADGLVGKTFASTEDFKNYFNEAIKAVTYEKEYTPSIKKYSVGTYSDVLGEEELDAARSYYYFTAENIENYEFISRIDFSFSTNLDIFPQDYLISFSNKELSDEWSAFDNAMDDLTAKMIVNSNSSHRFAVANGNMTSDIFTVKTKNKSGLIINGLGAEDGLRPKFIATYDKTAEIASECIMSPSDDEVETDIGEIEFNWKFDIDLSTFISDNIRITDGNSEFNRYSLEIEDNKKQKIVFNDELESEKTYTIELNNIKASNGDSLSDRAFRLTTKGVITGFRASYKTVLNIDESTEFVTSAIFESGRSKAVDAICSSTDDNVVTFNQNGKATAVGYGAAFVSVEYDGMTEQFPIYVTAKNICEKFENNGEASTEHKYEGNYAKEGNTEFEKVIDCDYSSFVAEGYFYDDMSNSKKGGISFFEEGFVGIDTELTNEKYVALNSVSNISRCEGWHKIIFDVSNEISIYIDGIFITSTSNSDYNALYVSGDNIWFDNLSLNYIKNSDPEIKDLKITGVEADGTINIGNTIEVTYTYFDADNDADNGTEYGFYWSDSINGEYSLLAADVNKYTFNTADKLDLFIKFIITPKNDISSGKIVETKPYHLVLGVTTEKMLEKINNADVYEMKDLIEMYGAALNIDIDEINEYKNTLYIYNELVNRSFSVPNDILEAVNQALINNLDERKFPLNRAVGLASKSNTVEDILNMPSYNTYLHSIALIQKISNLPAVKKITFTAWCNYFSTHLNFYSTDEFKTLPTSDEFKAYAENAKKLVISSSDADGSLKMSSFVYPDLELNEDGNLVTIFGNTDNRQMFFNGSAESKRPYYTVTYDKTALFDSECLTSPENFEKEIDPGIRKMTFAWTNDLAEGNWIAENVSVYNSNTNEPVAFTLSENEINFSEQLADETTYIVSTKNLEDKNGNKLIDRTMKFMTTGKYKRLNLTANTNVSVGDKIRLAVKGEFWSGKENNIPLSGVEVVSDNTGIVSIENSEIIAKNRGNAILTVTKTNYDGSKVSNRIIITVYNKSKNEDFESDGCDEKSYSGSFSLKSDGTNQSLISFDNNDTAEVWYYDNAITDEGCIMYGAEKISLRTDDSSWHQLVFIKNRENKINVYRNGDLIKSFNANGADTLIANVQSNQAYFDNCNMGEVIGSTCRAENVVLRGSNYAGRTVEGFYGYFDPDNDIEQGTDTYFEISESENGSYSRISTGKTLTLSSSYNNQYVRFAVTPKNYYDEGTTVYSKPINVLTETNSGGSGSSSSKVALSMGSVQSVIEEDQVTQTYFTDVSKEHFAYDAVMQLKENGIIDGKTEMEFEPESSITKAEFTKLIVRALGKPETAYQNIFTDVSEKDWFAKDVQTAYNEKIISGFGGCFEPLKEITREEMVKMIVCAYNNIRNSEIQEDKVIFSDQDDISDWAVNYVSKAYTLGIIKGMNNNEFCPKLTATRAQAAVIISRFIALIK